MLLFATQGALGAPDIGTDRGRPRPRLPAEEFSSAGRLRITAGAALDDSGIDRNLDPHLRLLTAEFDGQTHELQGTEDVIEIAGTDTVDMTVTILRGPDTVVRVAIEPEAVSA